MVFATPLIDNMLSHNFTNAVNFEHTYVISHEMVIDLLEICGLELLAVHKFSPYANFYAAVKNHNTKIKRKLDYSKHKRIFQSFIDYHLSEVKNIQSRLPSKKHETFIFGAHIFTQYLLNFGLQEESFLNILDNDPNKIGNRLYGTRLTVKSPKLLENYDKPTVVLKAAQYTEEIKLDILQNINPNTRFIL